MISPRPLSLRPWARATLVTLPLALLACEEKSAPPSPPAAPRTAPPPAPSATAPADPTAPAILPSAPVPTATPTPDAPPPAGPPRKPEQLFTELGCSACHGEGRPFATRIAEARGKPDETIAMWILDPQKVRPGTIMPTFVGRLSTIEALSLARWIKAGNPVIPGSP